MTTETETTERFVKVFNGTYTITSPTGEHRTFLIRTQAADAGFAPNKRIVALLTGPNNERDFQGFGFIDDNGISVWRKRLGTATAPSLWEQYGKLLWSLATEGEQSRYYAKGARLLVEGRCCRCNRKLTHPTSILTGIGKKCREAIA